tara:strand:+ start:561 stop:2360 length:1800 start_codon:yes stop_codon:yes gene_type:complete
MRVISSFTIAALGISMSTQQRQVQMGRQKQNKIEMKFDDDKNGHIKYDGYFLVDEFRSGTKTFYNDNGHVDLVETGDFTDQVLSHGRRTYSTGGTDDGEFKNGGLHGKGTRTYPNGAIENGVFHDNEFVEGVKIYPDGGKDEGQFKDGVLTGEGTRITPDGSRYEGKFENDELIKGRIEYASTINNGVKSIAGEINFFLLSGKGQKTFANRDYLSGQFENSRLVEGDMKIGGKFFKLHNKSAGKLEYKSNIGQFYLNGQYVLEGEHLGSSECLKKFDDFNTPFLFNKKQALDASLYFQNESELISQIKDAFKIKLLENKEKGGQVLSEIFEKVPDTLDKAMVDQIEEIFHHMFGYDYDQKIAILFTLVDMLNYTDQEIEAQCQALLPIIKSSRTVFNGLRTMSRNVIFGSSFSKGESDVKTKDKYDFILKGVLFDTFGKLLANNQKFSNIDCSFQLFEGSQGGSNGFNGFFITTNIDQFNAIWKAKVDSNSEPPKPSAVQLFDLESINGISYRIPDFFIHQFRKRISFDQLYIDETMQFNIPKNLSEQSLNELNEWVDCVRALFKTADSTTDKKNQSSFYMYIISTLVIFTLTNILIEK